MSDATIWEGPSESIPAVNGNGNIFEEVQVAAGGQTVFTLTSFTYTPGTRSIFVWRKTAADGGIGGEMLRRTVDYTETSTTKITLAAGAVAGDTLIFIGLAVNQLINPTVFNGIPQGGTAGQVLQKASSSDYDADWADPSVISTLLDAARVNVASASTVNLVAIQATTRNIQITGTTQIDGFQITNGQLWALRFSGALVLKNNASIVTQSGADINIAAGATCLIRATADNVVEVLSYVPPTKFEIVDRAYTEYTTNVNIATVIPIDDTIPQDTEGTQILSATLTPKSATNRLRVRAVMFGDVSAAATIVMAAFKAGTANAIRVVASSCSATGFLECLTLEHEFVPGSTAAITINIRVGPGAAVNLRLNGTAGGRLFGGAAAATLILEEIAA